MKYKGHFLKMKFFSERKIFILVTKLYSLIHAYILKVLIFCIVVDSIF